MESADGYILIPYDLPPETKRFLVRFLKWKTYKVKVIDLKGVRPLRDEEIIAPAPTSSPTSRPEPERKRQKKRINSSK